MSTLQLPTLPLCPPAPAAEVDLSTVTVEAYVESDEDHHGEDPDYMPEDTCTSQSDDEDLVRDSADEQGDAAACEPPRKKKRNDRQKSIPPLGKPCDEEKCSKKCSKNISESRRKVILDAYWGMTTNERRSWIFHQVSRGEKHRSTTGSGHTSRRNMTYTYHYGRSHEVCKTFFLTSLEYHSKNDKPVMTALRSASLSEVASPRDKRGRHPPSNKLNKGVI